jgi:hypothetical protein
MDIITSTAGIEPTRSEVMETRIGQWRQEYLLSIREAASLSNNGTRDVIVEGDIVILKNESTKQLFWKIAKVEELIRSIDGVVRSAKIRVLNSETRKPIII